MFILDDILLFPAKGIFWIFRELHNAVQAEIANEAETITAQLSELYMELETGRITTADFDAREKELLDRLDEIEARGIPNEDEPLEENGSDCETENVKESSPSFSEQP